MNRLIQRLVQKVSSEHLVQMVFGSPFETHCSPNNVVHIPNDPLCAQLRFKNHPVISHLIHVVPITVQNKDSLRDPVNTLVNRVDKPQLRWSKAWFILAGQAAKQTNPQQRSYNHQNHAHVYFTTGTRLSYPNIGRTNR